MAQREGSTLRVSRARSGEHIAAAREILLTKCSWMAGDSQAYVGHHHFQQTRQNHNAIPDKLESHRCGEEVGNTSAISPAGCDGLWKIKHSVQGLRNRKAREGSKGCLQRAMLQRCTAGQHPWCRW